MADGHGGARPGSGRKPKRQTFESEITRADKRIAKNLVRYIENMERLADGVTVQEADKDGDEVIYTRAPDRQANEYLLNRIMGKPTERKEIRGSLTVEEAAEMSDEELEAEMRRRGLE